MIDRRELLASAGNLGLLPNVVEKDYVWAGSLRASLTMLTDESHLQIDFLLAAFREIGAWVYEQTGIELTARQSAY